MVLSSGEQHGVGGGLRSLTAFLVLNCTRSGTTHPETHQLMERRRPLPIPYPRVPLVPPFLCPQIRRLDPTECWVRKEGRIRSCNFPKASCKFPKRHRRLWMVKIAILSLNLGLRRQISRFWTKISDKKEIFWQFSDSARAPLPQRRCPPSLDDSV